MSTRRDLRAFIRLPWRLYRNERNWVPPLRAELRRHLDRRRNPWFRHAEAEYFLARRDGRVVGRITAHVDRNLNEFQGNRWGLFGFFECEDDQEAADGLVAAAAEWLTARGRDRMVGPMNFTTNDECGLLVESIDRPPMLLCPWTHPYYVRLLEGTGLAKEMDAYMWELRIEGKDQVHPAIWEVAEKVGTEHGIEVRHFRKRDLEAEVERFLEVYNAAWQRNWGFVPLEDDEVRAYAQDLRPVLSEDWAWVAEKDGEPVAAALSLPDFNQVLIHLNGRLLPIGWLKALWWRRKIERVRVFALGVKPEHQHTGVGAKLYAEHYVSAETTPIRWGEMGWILETNKAMNRAMEGMGGKIVRTYRFYGRPLAAGAGDGS